MFKEKRRRMDQGELSLHRGPQPNAELDELYLDFALSHEPALSDWCVKEDGILQLSERSMSVHDRAAFAEAKKKELQVLRQ